MLILVTLFIQGSLTESLIRYLKVPIGVSVDETPHTRSADFEEAFCYPLLIRSWNTAPESANTLTSLTSPLSPVHDNGGCCCFSAATTAVICGSPLLTNRKPTAVEAAMSSASVVSESSGGGSINHEFGTDALFSSPWRSPISRGRYATPTRHCQGNNWNERVEGKSLRDMSTIRSRTNSETESDGDASRSLVTSISSNREHNTDSPNLSLSLFEETAASVRFNRMGSEYNPKERLRIPVARTEHNTLVGAFMHQFESTLDEEEEDEDDELSSFYTPTGNEGDEYVQ